MGAMGARPPENTTCQNQEDPPFTEYRWVVLDYETRLVLGAVASL